MIKKFVECTIPISQCNLRCSYCYVIQEKRRNTKTSDFKVSPQLIGKAFAQERWGGEMLVNLCAFGETLLLKSLPEIVFEILKQGHYINITNNGTITERIEQLLELPGEMLSRVCFAFSLHYVELKQRELLQVFANNVHRVKNAGCSFTVQLNLCDEYIDCIDEIKNYCIKQFGALPQVALTRREGDDYSIFTNKPELDYVSYAKSFDSTLFDFTYKNFKVKRKEFCYAGDWTYKLDIASGELRSCYFSPPFFNIYDRIDKPIPKSVVGNNCRLSYCVNSSHFISLGVIPDIKAPTYVELRNRDCSWYNEKCVEFLSGKLYEANKEYSPIEKQLKNISFRLKYCRIKRIPQKLFRIVSRKV